MSDLTLHFIVFNLFVVAFLWLDLKVLHREDKPISIRHALWWTLVWVCFSLLFNAGVYYFNGSKSALEFLGGYLVEKSLSVDNIFVFILIFGFFKVEPKYQHKVLFWGILTAIVLRMVFILTGVALIQHFHWVVYVFGGFLVISGLRMAITAEREMEPEKSMLFRFIRWLIPLSPDHDHGRFVVRRNGKLMATSLLVALVALEISDVIFAFDSIPAILAISLDPFIVYTSNIFAIFGLRSLFFAISGLMPYFHYLKYGLAVVLAFVGSKMLISEYYEISTGWSLVVLLVVLGGSVGLSLIFPRIDDTKLVKNS